jgi:hypothetical protein
MFRLVYVSSASQPFTKAELQALLEQARQKNTKLGVTGMLLYKDGNFMQALEGQGNVLRGLVGTIERDSRHKGILILLRGTSEERLFPNWSMGFRDLTDQDERNAPGYSAFMNTPFTEAEFTGDPNRCLKLLLSFKKNM